MNLVRKTVLVLLCLLLAGITGCIGVSQEEYDRMAVQLRKAQIDVERIQRELDAANSQVDALKKAADQRAKEAADYKRTLENTMDTNILLVFHVSFKGSDYYWTLPVPLKIYVTDQGKERPATTAARALMAYNPDDRETIATMARIIGASAGNRNLTQLERVNLIAAFLQSLAFTPDIVNIPYSDKPMFPVETLFRRGGDSQDSSILAASLLNAMNFDVVIINFPEQQHMAVGINISGGDGEFVTFQNKKYYFLELTGINWTLGQLPPGFILSSAEVFHIK